MTIRQGLRRIARDSFFCLEACLIVFFIIAVISSSANCMASQDPPSEDKVKAAFIYNFLKFVEWPKNQNVDRPIRLGVMGKTPLASLLNNLTGKSLHSRTLRVIKYRSICDSLNFQALFIATDINKSEVAEMLQELDAMPVLTISDINKFIQQGGMIELFREGNKIRFKINLAAANAAHLKISSKLLKLAREVIR